MGNFEHLLSPITIAGRTYKNRIGASPMGRFMVFPDGSCPPPTDYIRKARGGSGMVAVGEAFVDSEYSCREDDPPLEYTDYNGRIMDAAKLYVDAIRNNGAIAMIELNHCGQSKVGSACSNKTAIGPMAFDQGDGIVNVAMDLDMMRHVADNFAQCAYFMKVAGFDGVIPFCGHGWLLHQFLSPRLNKRTDEFGGSIENRCKFPVMVIRRIRERCGSDFIIEPRVSGEEAVPGGMEVNEVSVFCEILAREGLADIIQVSQGIYREPVLSREFSSMFHRRACNSHLSKYIKQHVDIPVSVVGGINSPELGEQILSEGRCDFILLGRQYTADMEFGKKTAEGNADEVNHCVRCARCFSGPHEEAEMDVQLDADGNPIMEPILCTVNPMHSRPVPEGGFPPPEKLKRVLVAGGGVAGMQAAIAAADRGHSVTLAEKTDSLGGLLKFCDYDVHKDDLKFFKDQLQRKLARRGVRVLLDTEADAALIAAERPEHIIAAVGSHPAVFPIPGIENAIHALEVYWSPEKVGKKVVIIGGGLVGCETGLHLADTGHEVVIIEMADRLAAEGVKLHRVMLLHLLEKKAETYTGMKCSEVTGEYVKAVGGDGREHIFFGDTIVYALGMRPNSDTVEALRKAAGDIPFRAVGDCLKVQQIPQAGYDAYTAAYEI